jgi:hypothetical protein
VVCFEMVVRGCEMCLTANAEPRNDELSWKVY